MAKIILLSYVKRSGSTFLAKYLCRHPAIAGGLESAAIGELLRKFPNGVITWPAEEIFRFLTADIDFSEWPVSKNRLLANLEAADIPHTFQSVMDCVLESFDKKAEYLLLKGKGLCGRVTDLSKLLPDMAVIYLVRDPRGVFNSQRQAVGTSHRLMSSNPLTSAVKWRRYTRNIRSINNVKILEVRYEPLITSTDNQLASIAEFIGIPPVNMDGTAGESFLKDIPSRQRHLHTNVDRAGIRSRCEAWKAELDKTDRYLIQMYCRKEIESLGLPVEEIRLSLVEFAEFLFKSLFYVCSAMLKLARGKISPVFQTTSREAA